MKTSKKDHLKTQYPTPTNKHGQAAKDPIPDHTTKDLSKDLKKRVQQMVGSILYYTWAVNITLLMVFSIQLYAEQSKATEFTMNTVKQLVHYFATHPNAKIRYKKSDMILNIHSDSSYLGVPKTKSHTAGHFFLR